MSQLSLTRHFTTIANHNIVQARATTRWLKNRNALFLNYFKQRPLLLKTSNIQRKLKYLFFVNESLVSVRAGHLFRVSVLMQLCSSDTVGVRVCSLCCQAALRNLKHTHTHRGGQLSNTRLISNSKTISITWLEQMFIVVRGRKRLHFCDSELIMKHTLWTQLKCPCPCST